MRNLGKTIKLGIVAAGVAMIAGSFTANAQSAIEPWTGAIPGGNYDFPGNSSLNSIRKLLNEGRVDAAVTFAKRNVASQERDSRSGRTSEGVYDAYNALCVALTAKQSYDEAIEACDKAIDENSNRWMAYNSRGTANLKKGNFSEALNDYNVAMQNSPNTSAIREILEHNRQIAQRGSN